MPAATIPYEEVRAELLADPEVKAAYDALEPAFQIARLRIERGLTQAQLAELVGTKQPSIARLERGVSEPSLTFLRKLAAALGMRVEISFVPVEPAQAVQLREHSSAEAYTTMRASEQVLGRDWESPEEDAAGADL